MSRRIYSYVTIPSDAVQIEWFVYDMVIPEDGLIKQWRKNRDLEVSAFILLNQDQVKAAITPKGVASIVLYWHSPHGRDGTFLHGLGKKIKLLFDDSTNVLEIEADFIIDGKSIAGAVQLGCAIILDSVEEKRETSIFAQETGSVLFDSSTTISLEGTQALFPVVAVDFHSLDDVAPGSLYFLKKKFSQLDSNFSSAYKLYFNSTHPLFQAVNSDNEKDTTAQYLLKLIMYDIYRTIVEDALSDNGIQDLSYDENDAFTLKSVYSKIVMALQEEFFTDKNLESLKNMLNSGREEDRNALYTAIQQYVMGGK